MDRKYKQRGYMDGGGKEDRPKAATPKQKSDMRTPNMPAFREVTRCHLCGAQIKIELGGIGFDDKCPKCNTDLRVCKNCVSFDPGARFQCRKAITERIPKKDVQNHCELFEPRKTVERETSAAPASSKDPRSAFDQLFKR